MEVQELTWGNSEQIQALENPDIILLADCIYYEEVSVKQKVKHDEDNASFCDTIEQIGYIMH